MTIMPGISDSKVLLDSDAIVGFYVKSDPLYDRVSKISEKLATNDVQLFCCVTVLTEVMTVFQRVFGERSYAEQAYELIIKGQIQLLNVDTDLLSLGHDIWKLSNSKKNTIFDAINIAAVKKYNLDAIFSFDSWYKKQGVKLAEDL